MTHPSPTTPGIGGPASPPIPDCLVWVGRWLRESGYEFTTITPASHERVNARSGAQLAQGLRDVFGWSRPFTHTLLPPEVRSALQAANLLEPHGELLRSLVRFSSLASGLYAHSAFPTTQPDSVFFGPDTYRFAALIEAELARMPLGGARRIVDIGCGGGPGGIVAALASGAATGGQLVLGDINPRALLFAQANAQLAGLAGALCVESNLFQAMEGEFDLIVSNPPYLLDPAERTYRHGGGPLGGGLSLRIAAEGLPLLAPGGRLVLYTGSAMVDGRDPLLESLRPVLAKTGWPFTWRELDPDVFGEELDTPAYAGAERIAAVALVVQRPVA